MKTFNKVIGKSLLLVLLSGAQAASAFYDANLGRWLNRDPLSDNGSVVYEVGGRNPTIQLSAINKLTASGSDALSMFTAVNANLYTAVGNNPIQSTDAYGLSFSDCWQDCMNGTALPLSVDAAAAANGMGNVCFGRTPRGGIATPVHPTSWQHRLGSNLGASGSRIGKFLGRFGVALTIGVGLYDLARIAGCSASCGLPAPPADADPSYMYIQ
jgi:hypothetical protein